MTIFADIERDNARVDALQAAVFEAEAEAVKVPDADHPAAEARLRRAWQALDRATRTADADDDPEPGWTAVS